MAISAFGLIGWLSVQLTHEGTTLQAPQCTEKHVHLLLQCIFSNIVNQKPHHVKECTLVPRLGNAPFGASSSLEFGNCMRVVTLPPSGAVRSQVDQGGDTGAQNEITKLTAVQHLNVQRWFIHPLQPSCDAQDTAICWQVDQKGHTSQQGRYITAPNAHKSALFFPSIAFFSHIAN